MDKLSYDQAKTIIAKSCNEVIQNQGYRYGQAIWNNLHKDIIGDKTGTELDFFYIEDHEKVNEIFWNNYVDLDKENKPK